MQIILFDIDGVLIRPPEYFTHVLERTGYPDAIKIMNDYYNGPNIRCNEGFDDPLIIIKPYLDKMGWPETVEEYLQEQYSYEAQFVDDDLLEIICRLRKQGSKCYLATDQDYHRSIFLLEQLGFKNKFDGWFISSQIGYRKVTIEYWEHVRLELSKVYPGLNLRDVIYFDDVQSNIETAKVMGLSAFHVKGQFEIEKMKRLLVDELK